MILCLLYYGLHTLHAIYPLDLAEDRVVWIQLFFKYLHPLLWYFFPVFVIYTVCVLFWLFVVCCALFFCDVILVSVFVVSFSSIVEFMYWYSFLFVSCIVLFYVSDTCVSCIVLFCVSDTCVSWFRTLFPIINNISNTIIIQNQLFL